MSKIMEFFFRELSSVLLLQYSLLPLVIFPCLTHTNIFHIVNSGPLSYPPTNTHAYRTWSKWKHIVLRYSCISVSTIEVWSSVRVYYILHSKVWILLACFVITQLLILFVTDVITLPVTEAKTWNVRGKGKDKAVPLQARSGPEGSRKLSFPDHMTTAQDGGKAVSLTHRPPLPPGNAPGTHFC